MKYNKNSIYENPLVEIPRRCSECLFFEEGSTYGDYCNANGCRTITYGFIDPADRALPTNLICPWWYANRIWNKVAKEKIEGYKEMRLHLLAFWTAVNAEELYGDRKKSLIKHLSRPGGGGVIDFDVFPEMRKYYKIVKENDGGC